MAEQSGHDVVNQSESASASLVDVAANPIIESAASEGIPTINHTAENESDLHISQAANQNAVQVNKDTSDTLFMDEATSEVEPRAGDAADVVTGPDIAHDTAAAGDDIAPSSQLANGTHDTAMLGEGPADDASLDISLNSDTEGSRGDGSEVKKDEQHHTRTNSVKKPVSFSKVSVTKSFLAKSATASPIVAKTGDKPGVAGLAAQPAVMKPRLIAKSGTTLRDVQKARLGAEPASGPDASKVWNKNRPVAPPPPKQFTDDELKQQYGIHLATRLQTDENGKESKWADIDDDEEDWAPEAVVWMDGTKSTFTSNETAALAQKEQIQILLPAVKPGAGLKPMLELRKQTELGPTKTILKPGASAAAAQAKQTESATGVSAERATLLAKSPAAVPSKSPWAVLPPVDTVSPVIPPVQQKQPLAAPFTSQDARVYEQMLPTPPAREIPADTFDRSWREGEGGTRELFNSANGRYEVVHDGGRRASIKPDRKPALLQRPSPTAPTPAEPSAAFQARSGSQTDGQPIDRRGSSVSHSSGPSARAMSMSKPSEPSPVPEKRVGIVVGHDQRASPQLSRNEPVPPVFSQQSAWQQQMPPRTEASETQIEDPVKVQERVMREKRELAKKRRQEEEQQAEADKAARLQARLAGLQGVGKSRKEREAEAAAAAEGAKAPPLDKAPELPQPSNVTDETAVPAMPEPVEAVPAPVVQPLVTSEGPASDHILAPPPHSKDESSVLLDRPIAVNDQAARDLSRASISPRANPRVPFQAAGGQYKAPASSYSSPGDRKQQPFGRSPLSNTDAFTPWPTTAPNGNVWGTSGIGNGTFESANVFAPMATSQHGSALPPPPGMGRQTGPSRISPQSLTAESRSPNLQQQGASDQPRAFGPPGLETARPDPFASQMRMNGPSPGPGLGRQTHLPGPIAPPSRAQQSQQQSQQPLQRNDGLAAWNTAAQRMPYQYKTDAEAAASRHNEPAKTMPRDDTFKETFRQTSAGSGELGAPRKYDKTEFTVHDAQGSRFVESLSPVPPSSQTQPSGPFTTTSPFLQGPTKMPGENAVRIPDASTNPAHGGQQHIRPIGSQHAQQSVIMPQASGPASAGPSASLKDSSPPPPETQSHPVNSSDTVHPLVKLPPEKAKVRLPPMSISTPTQPLAPQEPNVILPQRPVSSGLGVPGSARPIVMQEAWQARFNGLFNRTPIQTETPPSPPKTPPKMQSPALAVASSSRMVMDPVPAAVAATVSLPSAKKVTKEGFTIDDKQDTTSKPMIAQMFNEELSFGSLPKISIPRNVVYEAMYNRDSTLRAGLNAVPRAVDVQTEAELNLYEIHPRARDGVYVHLPALQLLKKFAKHHNGNRKASNKYPPQERKPSGRFKGKGSDDVPSAPSVATARKTSVQKTQPPATQSNTMPTTPAAEPSRKVSGPRPSRGRGRGPAPVKAA